MPPLETSCRNQKAVLWAANTLAATDGSPTVSAATEIDVRWQDVQDQITDSQSNLVEITAKVVVNIDVVIGSVLWLGALEDFDSTLATNDFRQMVGLKKIPDIKARHFRRVLLLKRLGNTLPTIV